MLDEWFAADSPKRLLDLYRQHAPSQVGLSRRMRLFECAAVRQVWDLLSNNARSAVLTSEKFAEGKATLTDLMAVSSAGLHTGAVTAAQQANEAAWIASWSPEIRLHGSQPPEFWAAHFAARAFATHATGPVPAGWTNLEKWHAAWNRVFHEAQAVHSEIARDIFPPPAPSIRCEPEWLTDTVTALAREMDGAGNYSAIPILADAFEEAGCDEKLILDVCRRPGPHVRGNWVVDLVLARD